MALPTSLIGTSTEPVDLAVDVRSTMAYPAGIDDLNPAYFDTTRPGGVVAHPLFAVRPEWPAVLAAGRLAPDVLTRDEARVGLHLTYDLTVHRLVRPDDVLTTVATVRSVARHRAGAFEIVALQTVDQDHEPVSTSEFGMLFPGVEVLADGGEPDPFPSWPVVSMGRADAPIVRELRANAAHVYTECSQIWNPIHTDPTVARAAGLAEIVLHGTASLAMAVSEVVDRRAGGDPTRIARIAGRFGALVTLPSTIEIHLGSPVVAAPATSARPGSDADGRGDGAHRLERVPFVVTNQDGDRAIRDGAVDLVADR